MNGYLWVQPVMEIHRERRLSDLPDESNLLAIRSSLEGRGWISLDAAIKERGYLKVSAKRDGIHYEARLFTDNIIPLAGYGTYEIRGGSLSECGAFVDVNRANPGTEFTLLFVCHSSSGDGKSLLKWWVGVRDVVDADNLPA